MEYSGRLILYILFAVAICAGTANPQQPGTASLERGTAAQKCIDADKQIRDEEMSPVSSNYKKRGSVASLKLNSHMTLDVIETQAAPGEDDYNPLLEIRKGDQGYSLPISRYIKFGKSLHLQRVRLLCVSPEVGVVVLAFEAGSTDSKQGFAFLRFSSDHFAVSAVPIIDQGQVEIDRHNPYVFNLWFASPRYPSECEACTQGYAVKRCEIQATMARCTLRKEALIQRNPNDVTADLIHVH